MPIRTPAQTLSIQGTDAIAFAHAQFSCNVRALALQRWQFGAWLNPQGRVRSLFHLMHTGDDALLLLLRGGDAQALASELQPFVFRARLTLQPAEDLWLQDAPARPLHELVESADGYVLGCGGHAIAVRTAAGDDAHRREREIDLGWPWLPASLAGELLAPSLSLMRLAAVSLDKGCYPGQEIVARLHYRGGSKRHLYTVSLGGNPAPDSVLSRTDGVRLQLLNVAPAVAGSRALAVLPDAALQPWDGAPQQAHFGGLTVSFEQRWDL